MFSSNCLIKDEDVQVRKGRLNTFWRRKMSQFKVGRSTSHSIEAPNQYPDEMPRSKSSSVGETTHQQAKRTEPSPSEGASKKREIDAEGKAQQARLENQFKKNPIVDAARKLVLKNNIGEEDLQKLERILQKASKEELATILKVAKNWNPTAMRLVSQAFENAVKKEQQMQEVQSNIRRKEHDSHNAIIEKMR